VHASERATSEHEGQEAHRMHCTSASPDRLQSMQIRRVKTRRIGESEIGENMAAVRLLLRSEKDNTVNDNAIDTSTLEKIKKEHTDLLAV